MEVQPTLYSARTALLSLAYFENFSGFLLQDKQYVLVYQYVFVSLSNDTAKISQILELCKLK